VVPVTPPSSRAASVRRWAVVVLAPAVLLLLGLGPRFGGLLAAMWVVLAGTVAVAATSRGEQRSGPPGPRLR
jgi:hypothetical protein